MVAANGDVAVGSIAMPAVIGERADPLCNVTTISDDGPGIAKGAEILARIEAETADRTKPAGAATAPCCAMCLCGVFDNHDPSPIAQFAEGIHVHRLAE
jgi:hypothetical protein